MSAWLSDVKGWFQAIMAFFKAADQTAKKVWEWTLNHVYALIPVVVAVAKSIWDFFVALANRVIAKLSSIDLDSVRGKDGLFANVLDVLAFANTIVPLEELFTWVMALIVLWGVCVLVRSILSAKRLLFG